MSEQQGQLICQCQCGGNVYGVAQLGRAFTWCDRCTPVQQANPSTSSATAEPLTKEERAYRRGALQAIEFLLTDLSAPVKRDGGPAEMVLAARYRQELIAGRDSLNPAYLGTYMDEIRRLVKVEREKGEIEMMKGG